MIVHNKNVSCNGFFDAFIPSEINAKIRTSDFVAMSMATEEDLTVETSRGEVFEFDLSELAVGTLSDLLHTCLNEKIIVGSNLLPLYMFARRHCHTRWKTQATLDASLYAIAVFGVDVSSDEDPTAWFHSLADLGESDDFGAVLDRLIEIDEEKAGREYFGAVEPWLHARTRYALASVSRGAA